MKKKPKRRDHQEMLSAQLNYQRITTHKISEAQEHLVTLMGKAKKGMSVFIIQYMKDERTFNHHLLTFETKPKLTYDVVLANNASILAEYQNTTFNLMQKRVKYN